MKRQQLSGTCGFTLVELSIVLVIIGLLIGGILVAQSMIGTTKVQAFIRQIQQYDIAATNHLNKYQGWPGDDGRYQPALVTDGQITDDDDYYNNTNGNYQENMIYFTELRVMDGLVIENCPNINTGAFYGVPVTSGPGCSVPLGKLGKNNMIFAFSNHWGGTGFPGNYYFFVDCSQMVDQYFGDAGGCGAPFSGAEALAYDSKIDDGKANSGKVLGFYNTLFPQMCFGDSPCVALSGAAYNVTSSSPKYNMTQKITPDMQP